MRQGFLFDLNKCVGCQACVIACQIENHESQSEPWRSMTTFNGFQYPGLPLFHFSLACNHCDDPLCLTHCPARAYTKDPVLLTIDHHEDLCIGCRYCTWACPYDAPKFVPSKGVIEKCTMCKSRLGEGLKPNCANLCPTGALDFGLVESVGTVSVPGFPDKGIGPAIALVPMRKRSRSSIESSALSEYLGISQTGLPDKFSKVSVRQEWALAIFTVVAAALVALFASAVVGVSRPSPIAFLASGALAAVLSMVHLGKPLRAWRAILNLGTSWLSREVLAYTLFLVAAGGFFFMADMEWMGIAGIILGSAALIAIDMVYEVGADRPLPAMHSASVVLSGLLFFAALVRLDWLFILIASLKFVFYLLEHVRRRNRGPAGQLLTIVRVAAGFVVPFIFLKAGNVPALTILLLLIGETINRGEFYDGMAIVSPAGEMAELLERLRPRVGDEMERS